MKDKISSVKTNKRSSGVLQAQVLFPAYFLSGDFQGMGSAVVLEAVTWENSKKWKGEDVPLSKAMHLLRRLNWVL